MAWTTIASDSFNRGNGPIDQVGLNTLDNALGGSGTRTWSSTVASQWSIGSAELGLSGSTSSVYFSGTSGSPDQSVDLNVRRTNMVGGPQARWSAGSGGTGYSYLVYFNTFNSNQLSLYKSSSGGSALLDQITTFTLSVGDVLRVQCVGTGITGWVNGTQLLSATDTDLTDGVGAIFGDGTVGAVFDDFVYQEQPVTAAGSPWYAYAQQRRKTELDRGWQKRGPLWTPEYSLRKAA